MLIQHQEYAYKYVLVATTVIIRPTLVEAHVLRNNMDQLQPNCVSTVLEPAQHVLQQPSAHYVRLMRPWLSITCAIQIAMALTNIILTILAIPHVLQKLIYRIQTSTANLARRFVEHVLEMQLLVHHVMIDITTISHA